MYGTLTADHLYWRADDHMSIGSRESLQDELQEQGVLGLTMLMQPLLTLCISLMGDHDSHHSWTSFASRI